MAASQGWQGRIWGPAAVAAGLGAATGLWLPVSALAAGVALLLWAAVAVAKAGQGRSAQGRVAAWWVVLLLALLRAWQIVPTEPPGPDPATALDLPRPRAVPPIQRFRVETEPERSPGGYRFEARWLATCLPKPGSGLACTERRGRLQVDLTGKNLPLRSGDVVRVPAFTSPPPAYLNPGAYDLRDAWARDGLLGRIRIGHGDRIWVEPPVPPEDLAGWLGARQADVAHRIARARRYLATRLTEKIPGRPGQILAALALGDKGGRDGELQAWLQATGTAHVMAVSGSHLALVVWAVRLLLAWTLTRVGGRLLRRWPRERLLAWPCVAVAWTYALLTGAASATTRAAVMATAILLGRATGRAPGLGESLGLAFVALLLADPAAIADVGLVLSVAGVLGLAWAGSLQPHDTAEESEHQPSSLPVLDSAVLALRLQRIRTWANTAVVALWRSCLGPFALTAPVTLLAFSALSLLSPLANLAAVPAAALLLPIALLLMGLCAVPGVPAAWLAAAGELAVQPIQAALVHLPATAWPVWRASGLPALAVGLAVPLLLAWAWHGRPWRRPALALVVTAALCIGWEARQARVPEGEVWLSMLDVGHGDSALLEFSDGTTMLVDGGGELGDDGRVGALAVVPFLQRRGIRRIDVMVLSHAHPDHENGLLAVARVMPVGELWWNGQIPGGDEHPALLAALARNGTRWREFATATATRQFSWGGADIRVLSPSPDQAPYVPGLGHNDNSLVLEVEIGGRRLLLSGDVELAAEAALVRGGALRPIDVLKVPHHGSATSSTPALLAALQPRLALAGARPWGTLSFPHPAVTRRYADAGVPLWSTADGWVHVRMGVNGVTARQQRRFLELRSEVELRLAPRREHRAGAGVPAAGLADGGRHHGAVAALGAGQEVAAALGDFLQDLVGLASRHAGRIRRLWPRVKGCEIKPDRTQSVPRRRRRRRRSRWRLTMALAATGQARTGKPQGRGQGQPRDGADAKTDGIARRVVAEGDDVFTGRDGHGAEQAVCARHRHWLVVDRGLPPRCQRIANDEDGRACGGGAHDHGVSGVLDHDQGPAGAFAMRQGPGKHRGVSGDRCETLHGGGVIGLDRHALRPRDAVERLRVAAKDPAGGKARDLWPGSEGAFSLAVAGIVQDVGGRHPVQPGRGPPHLEIDRIAFGVAASQQVAVAVAGHGHGGLVATRDPDAGGAAPIRLTQERGRGEAVTGAHFALQDSNFFDAPAQRGCGTLAAGAGGLGGTSGRHANAGTDVIGSECKGLHQRDEGEAGGDRAVPVRPQPGPGGGCAKDGGHQQGRTRAGDELSPRCEAGCALGTVFRGGNGFGPPAAVGTAGGPAPGRDGDEPDERYCGQAGLEMRRNGWCQRRRSTRAVDCTGHGGCTFRSEQGQEADRRQQPASGHAKTAQTGHGSEKGHQQRPFAAERQQDEDDHTGRQHEATDPGTSDAQSGQGEASRPAPGQGLVVGNATERQVGTAPHLGRKGRPQALCGRRERRGNLLGRRQVAVQLRRQGGDRGPLRRRQQQGASDEPDQQQRRSHRSGQACPRRRN